MRHVLHFNRFHWSDSKSLRCWWTEGKDSGATNVNLVGECERYVSFQYFGGTYVHSRIKEVLYPYALSLNDQGNSVN